MFDAFSSPSPPPPPPPPPPLPPPLLPLQLDWVSYATSVYADAGVTVNSNLTLLVRTPSYFTKLSDLFESVNTSKPR